MSLVIRLRKCLQTSGKWAMALLVLSALALPGSAAADSRVIAPGVSVDGVDLSSLTVDAATTRVLDALVPALARPIAVGAAGHIFRLSPATVALTVDGPTTARRAYAAGLAAHGGPVSVALAVHHDRGAVASWVAGVARRVNSPAHDAWLQITLTRLIIHPSSTGHALDGAGLARQIDAAVGSPTATRILHEKMLVTHPALDANRVIARNYTVVTVDRAHFRLRLFKALHVVASYPIAVGRAGLATPTGLYHVLERQVNPSWHVPNDSWAGSLAGTVVPPGPNDPIVARWLGLGGGIGIHGTNEPFSVGSAASHGCIRMLPADVIALYPRVPLDTTVYIS